MSRSITGLDPVQDLVCETLDVVQKITINGETPSSKQFLSYNPDNDTTEYQDIDPAADIDISSLTAITTVDNANDELLIYDATDSTNKKITPTNLITPKTVTGTAPIVSSDPTGSSTALSINVGGLDETTSTSASDKLLIDQGGVNKAITPANLMTPKTVTGTSPIVSSDPTGSSTALSIDITQLAAATSTNFADYLLINQSGVNKKVQKYILVPAYTADTGLTLGTEYQFSFTGGDLGSATITTSGDVTLTGLATSDPAVAGRLWNDGGTVKVSTTYSLTIVSYDYESLSNYTITVNSDTRTYNYMGPHTQTWTGLTGSTQNWTIAAGDFYCDISSYYYINCTTTGHGQSSDNQTYVATITDTSSDAQFQVDIES